MENKIYEAPAATVVEFNDEDILTTSLGSGDSGLTGQEDW